MRTICRRLGPIDWCRLRMLRLRGLRAGNSRGLAGTLLRCSGTAGLDLHGALLRADRVHLCRTLLVGSSGLRMLLGGRCRAAGFGGRSALRCGVVLHHCIALLDHRCNASGRLSNGLYGKRGTSQSDLCRAALVHVVELLLVGCGSAVDLDLGGDGGRTILSRGGDLARTRLDV